MFRFLAGVGAGSVAAAVTYAVEPVRSWWWVVGLVVAVVVWTGNVIFDDFG